MIKMTHGADDWTFLEERETELHKYCAQRMEGQPTMNRDLIEVVRLP